MLSSPNKNLFLQKKRSLSLRPKDSNTFPRKKKSSKIMIIKGPWSKEEDQLLKNWREKVGPKSWTKCAENIPGRTGKQCREHWNNSLNSNIVKGNWSSEEDFLIMAFYQKYNGSWKRMIPIFKSRTENSIKNRFFSQLRKIASRYIKTGKKEYSTKFGLDILMRYYDMGLDEAKKDFLNKNAMSESELEIYINNVEDLVKNKSKEQKFIELGTLNKNKNNNNNSNNNNDNNEIKKENKDKNDNITHNIDDIETFGKKDEEDKRKIINEENEENEENKKPPINPDETKTYDETFDIVINNDDKKDNKQKINEQKQNMDDKNNNKNNKLELDKKEYPIVNNNDMNNNNNDKNQLYTNNNFVNTINYNISNTINYNINNNNNYNNNIINNNYNGMNYNINNNNLCGVNDYYNNFPSNQNYNFPNNYNNYTFNNMRNNSFIMNNNNNPFYRKDTNNNIFYNCNYYLTKKSSDLSEFYNNYHDQGENNQRQNEVNPNYVLDLLNSHNSNDININNDFMGMNSGNIEPPISYLNNGLMNNQKGRIYDEKKNLYTLTPKNSKSFQFKNEQINNFSYKRSDSGIFSNFNQYGFNRHTSFGSIKEEK